MSSEPLKAIDSLADNLSESLGLQGATGGSGGGGEINQPLHDNFQSEIESPIDNNSNSSTMDTHNHQRPRPLASSLLQSPLSSASTEADSDYSFNNQLPSSSSSPERFIKTHIFDEEYRMDRSRRGKCLIFNHEHFHFVSQRKGTDYDAYRLKSCFENLGFDIEEHKDLAADGILEVLTKVSNADHSDADCLVCCFLTHGDEEKLHAKDITYPKRTVFELFTGEKCPTLKGKPKVFIIQACRGTQTDHGVTLDYQTDAASIIAQPINRTQTIPIWADFLISYSTVEGYYSYRNTFSGGPFVQSLVPHLEKYGTHYDLVSILTRVNLEVGIYEAKPDGLSMGKQIPQIVCTLTKKLVFRPKLGQRLIPSTISYRDVSFNQLNFQNSRGSQVAEKYPKDG